MASTDTASYLLQHLASTLYRQSDQILQERLGIGLAQYKLLMLLQTLPSNGQRKLANHLGQTEASISRQLKLLVTKDLVVITTNPDNKREHTIALTTKGLKMAEAAADILAKEDHAMLTGLSSKQQEQLLQMLNALHDDVCGLGKPFACDHTPNIGI